MLEQRRGMDGAKTGLGLTAAEEIEPAVASAA